MYPTQNYPVYPNQMQQCNPYLQPQVNAVKIDIHNPQAYGGANSQGQMNPIAPAQTAQVGPYNYPYAPVYNMPAVSQYNPNVAYPQPFFNPPMPVNPPAIQPQQATASAQAQAVAQAPAQVATPPVVVQPAPVVVPQVVAPQTTTTSHATAQTTTTTAPQVVTTVPPVPVVPAPVAVVPAPVTQTVNVNPPAAVVDAAPATQATATAQATAQAPVAPVAPVAAQPQDMGVDVNGILTDLASTNPDAQTAAIQKIAEIAQTNPAAAKAFVNEQTFGQLASVINADTSNLQGPTEKQDPNVLSPLEKAEINKQFAVYTLAILQKVFRDAINIEMQKSNYPDIAINDLPYIKEGIVDNLKDNPNPTIREACLSALNYVGRPEDKDVLRVLYDVSAKHDASPDVRAVASEYLSKLPA